jgi:hypothetical protein
LDNPNWNCSGFYASGKATCNRLALPSAAWDAGEADVLKIRVPRALAKTSYWIEATVTYPGGDPVTGNNFARRRIAMPAR